MSGAHASPAGAGGTDAELRPSVGLAAVRGRLAGPLAVLGSVGRLCVVAAVVALVTGLVAGWAELVAVGATLAAVVAVASLFLVGRARFAVDVGLSPRRVVAGERAIGSLAVRNASPRRSAPARFELPVGDGTGELIVPALASGASSEEVFSVPTLNRGVIVVGPARSVRGDPLGVFRRVVTWTEPVELLVHPRTARLRPSMAGLVRDLEGRPTDVRTDSDLSFHALRDYVRGDDVRHVHWRSSARAGRLLVKQFEESRRSELAIIHSADARHYASDEEFELSVSAAASIGVQALSDGSLLSVVSGGRRLRTRTPEALLDDCSRIEAAAGVATSVRDVARGAAAGLAAPSAVIVVSGSRMTTDDHRGVAGLFRGDTAVVLLRAAAGETPSAREVSGGTVLTVGELRQLPALLARAS